MGGGSSKPVEKKTVDSTGQVTNSFVVEEGQENANMQLLIATWIIAIIKLVELALSLRTTSEGA